MKLQPASRKEIARVSLGTVICDAIMIVCFFILSQFGIGTFALSRILLGAVCGSAVAILNFTVLCLTVQSAVGIEDQKQMKARFQLSYNLRLLLQAVWVVVCFKISQIHFLAGVIPIFFPNAVIYYLQIRNRLVTPSERTGKSELSDDDLEDIPGSFEV